MGKIRTKILGTQDEEEQKIKSKARREGKKARKARAPGMEGGARIVAMEDGPIINEPFVEKEKLEETEKKVKKEIKSKKSRGRKFLNSQSFVDKTKKYNLDEVFTLLKKTSYTKFDGTVEAHFNTDEKGLRGSASLPYGIGKEIKVAVATEELIKEIEEGKINFDILITTPDLMPKLAKIAKILGPKGLMPNPKSGTITTDTDALKDKLSKGQIQFKTEPEAPLIHSVIGKVSFTDEQLISNLTCLIKAIGKKHLVSLSLNCTMGPGLKINLDSVS